MRQRQEAWRLNKYKTKNQTKEKLQIPNKIAREATNSNNFGILWNLFFYEKYIFLCYMCFSE